MKLGTVKKIGKEFRAYSNKFESNTLKENEKEEFIKIVARVGNSLHATVIDLKIHVEYLSSKGLTEEFMEYRKSSINEVYPIDHIYAFNKKFGHLIQ